MDVALPALHAGSGPGPGCHRCPCPPPDQSDHCPSEEAATLPLPAPESQRRQCQSRRWLRVLRQRSMGEVEPPGDDASLSTVLVQRTDEIAQSPVARPSHATGISPAGAGVLIDWSKEPYA